MRVPPQLTTLLKEERSFFIATHINPEGDALGSSIALSMALDAMGKETVLYDKDPVPEVYRFLPGRERFVMSPEALQDGQRVCLLLDCNEPVRAGLDTAAIQRSAVIDHHETEKGFGDVRWIEPRAAATGMMVYYLLRELGSDITEEMAINLYTALAVDTGTFRYNNTTADVLRVAAELIELGAHPSEVAENLYETWSRNRFRLLTHVLDTLEIHDDVAMTTVTGEMFERTNTTADDTEHFSEFPRMIADIRIAALFRQTGDGWKVSLRSRGETNVAQVALEFGGGGHRNAAGYKVKTDIKNAKELLLRAVRRLSSS